MHINETNRELIMDKIMEYDHEGEYFAVSELNLPPSYETIQSDYMGTDEIFTVVFTMEAIEIIKRFSECMESHAPFRNFMERLNTIVLPELDRVFEQKLAMYISLNLKNKIRTKNEEIYIVNIEDVTREVTNLFHIVLNMCFKIIPSEGTINNMIDGYPLFILSKTCNTNMLNAHVIGESVRRFILIRKTYKRWMPVDLQIATISNCDIINDQESPLVKHELHALYRYLGIESRMYVTILLNCLFELKEHEKFFDKYHMTAANIIKICKSSWLCLIFSTFNLT